MTGDDFVLLKHFTTWFEHILLISKQAIYLYKWASIKMMTKLIDIYNEW